MNHSHHNPQPTPNWTTKDLFELASLDALGLLSDEESRAFEHAFAAAPAAVQEQIRDQQLRMSEIDSILPRVEPPASLRERVLAAVAAAIESLPGRTSPARVHRSARVAPGLLPSRGVHPIWRGVSIGCAAAMVVFAVATARIYSENREIERVMASNAVTETLAREFGAKFQRMLLNPRTQFVSFNPVSAGSRTAGEAVLLLDPASRTGQFFCANLPRVEGNFSLVVVSPDGKVVGNAIVTFRSSGSGIAQQDIANLDLAGGKSLALIAPSNGGGEAITLLRSAH